MTHTINNKATEIQMIEMLETLDTYIKLAVAIQRGILADEGVLHADCESVLISAGSLQADIWGADWIPSTQKVTFESLINIRPQQNYRSLEIIGTVLRD